MLEDRNMNYRLPDMHSQSEIFHQRYLAPEFLNIGIHPQSLEGEDKITENKDGCTSERGKS